MQTIYTIVLVFASWDACQDWAHANGIHDNKQSYQVCGKFQVTAKPKPQGVAPSSSLRPKLRPEGLGQ